MTQTLKEVTPGSTCEIVGIDCNNVLKNRLLCMGMTPGTCVEVVKTAPFGDPIELRVRNYNLSIRKNEASGIHVKNVRKCTVPGAGADAAKADVSGSVS
ncbi:ferrous iron transport protein A [Methanolapillus millepedarum]|uniref:Ferrous iron transporter FeoA-like domain-containing protein n=1 Tax=Methanolapillus millepedarum TaxID=3028296 RepID=A0AA96V1G4_9EURY|nr:hypothetical protein MsAc7_01510 [Methanosarcinaceae archaeon Ac7]